MMDYSEKRDFIRMPIQCPATIRSQRAEEPAALQDLSATGVRFISTQAFDAGERLQLTVAPPSPITPPLEAEIAVLRCRELEDGFDIAASIELVAPALYPEEN
jgi:hypothetical protein